MSDRIDFDGVLDLLEQCGCGPRLSGPDRAYARCPNHEDRKPSLSVGVGADGEVLVYCHAGCGFGDVLAALRGASPNGHRPDPEQVARVKARPVLRFVKISDHYYAAGDGTPLLKQRGQFLDPETGEVVDAKTFRWWWECADRWSPGDGGKVALLYRADLIEQAATTGTRLYLVEGEKDADRLIGMGLPATTTPHGAGSAWRAEWTRQLDAVSDLAVIADDDQRGRQHAADAAAQLRAARPDRAVSVFLCAAGCNDVSDHLDAGHGLDQLRELIPNGDGFVLAETVEQRTLEWLWPGWVPDRHVTVSEGDGGIGKSTVWVDLMARTTTGRPMPDGSPTRRGAVVYITNEDDIATVVKGRLVLAGADLSKVLVLDPQRADELSFPQDVKLLRRRVEAHGVVLVVIDPWSSFMSATLSNNSDQEFRRAIGPAQLMAQQLGVAVILLRHLRKGAGPARERGLGSVAIGNAARSVLLFKTDPDDETSAVIVQHKQNLGAPTRPLRYRISSDNPHDPSRARVEWRGSSPHTVADLIAVAEQEDEHRTQTDECADWLEDYLRDHQHEAERKAIMQAAKADGFSWGDRVWRDARKRLHIDATSRTKTERPGTRWRLPILPGLDVTSAVVTSPYMPDVTTDVTTAPGQQTRDLQAPAQSSRDVPTDIGHGRSALPVDNRPEHCRDCGQRLLLRQPGRDQCEKCRLAEQRSKEDQS